MYFGLPEIRDEVRPKLKPRFHHQVCPSSPQEVLERLMMFVCYSLKPSWSGSGFKSALRRGWACMTKLCHEFCSDFFFLHPTQATQGQMVACSSSQMDGRKGGEGVWVRWNKDTGSKRVEAKKIKIHNWVQMKNCWEPSQVINFAQSIAVRDFMLSSAIKSNQFDLNHSFPNCQRTQIQANTQ